MGVLDPVGPARSSERCSLKRRTSSDDQAKSSKRQQLLPAAPSSSPFQTLKVTKSGSAFHSSTGWKDCMVNHYKGNHHSITQITMSRCMSSSPSLLQETTMDLLTPYPSHRTQFKDEYAIAASQPDQDSSDFASTNPSADQHINEDARDDAALTLDDFDDEYPVDVDEEADMVRLLGETPAVAENRCPPSSVLDGWDRDSRSVDEYDPNLKYSSPQASSELNDVPQPPPSDRTSPNKPANASDDLLDEDVDWDAVFTITSSIQKDASLIGSREVEKTQEPAPINLRHEETSMEPSYVTDEGRPLAPFVRPEFPEKVRDRSSVPGVSSNTVLRRFFRIGHMIQETAHCHNHQQNVVFELYARVTYSSREKLVRKQHFQFMDLFKDNRPYPAGIFSSWRVGSRMDRQSSAFLNVNYPKLCCCLCKPHRDEQNAIDDCVWGFR